MLVCAISIEEETKSNGDKRHQKSRNNNEVEIISILNEEDVENEATKEEEREEQHVE